jgi:hypothetical protein
MTTLLDKQRSATSNIQNRDAATLDQVLSRIAALAPMVARHADDMEQARDCRRSSPEAGPSTKVRRCSDGSGIFASRRSTRRSIRATTHRRGPPCSSTCHESRHPLKHSATEAFR